jgi:hypothetical protein
MQLITARVKVICMMHIMSIERNFGLLRIRDWKERSMKKEL